MSADDLNVKIESTEINITVEDLPDLNIDSSPDVIVLMATPIGPQGIPGVSGLPEDIVVPNGTRILTNKFVAADSQPAFKLMADGKMWFGPGGSTPPDTNLYRHSSGRTLAAEATLLLNSPDNIPSKMLFSTEGGWPYAIFTAVLGQPAGAAGAGLAFKGGAVDNRADFDIYSQNDCDGLLIYKSNMGGTLTVGTGDLFRFNSNGLWFSLGNGKAGPAAVFDAKIYCSAPYTLRVNEILEVSQQLNIGVLNNAFLTLKQNNGAIWFGASPDTNLYRFSAGVIKTDGQMQIVGNLVVTANIYSQPASNGTGFLYNPQQPGGTAFYSITQGEANPRFYFSDNGAMWWGAGGSSPIDVNLYRPTVGQLRTNALFIASGQIYSQAAGNGGGFVYNPASGGGTAFNSSIQGLANPSVYIDSYGTINWGPGSTPTDTRLYRSAAGYLKTDTNFGAVAYYISDTLAWYKPAPSYIRTGDVITQIMRPSSGQTLGIGLNTDTTEHLRIDTNGRLDWGPGNGASDTNLYRTAAGILRTDSHFWALGQIFSLGSYVAANYGAATQVAIGDVVGGGSAGISFGTSGDTTLYRQDAGRLRARRLHLGLNLGPIVAGADLTISHPYSGNADSGLSLVASTSGTDSPVTGAFKIKSDVNGYYRVMVEYTGIEVFGHISNGAGQGFNVTSGKICFGGSNGVFGDTNLYRLGAGNLKTDGTFQAAGSLVASTAGAGAIYLRNDAGHIYLGVNDDTNLYRQQAGILKTDGIINAVGGLQINGVPVGTGGGTGPKITTSPISGGPPASPANGDIWYATGVGASSDRWAFQYNASSGSAYKWEFIGGAPLRAYIQGFQGGTTGAAWVDYGGPSVVWPRAGEMIIEFGAHFDVFNETGMIVVMADGNVVTDQIQSTTPVAGSSRIASSMMTIGVIWGPATLKIMYQATGTADWGQRWIKVTPVRIA